MAVVGQSVLLTDPRHLVPEAGRGSGVLRILEEVLEVEVVPNFLEEVVVLNFLEEVPEVEVVLHFTEEVLEVAEVVAEVEAVVPEVEAVEFQVDFLLHYLLVYRKFGRSIRRFQAPRFLPGTVKTRP